MGTPIKEFKMEVNTDHQASSQFVSRVNDDVNPSSKRLKLEDRFEYVLLETDVKALPSTSAITGNSFNLSTTNENSSISAVQSGITLIDIKGEENYEYESVNSPLENKELVLEDFCINNITDIDPLLPDENTYRCVKCDYNSTTATDLEKHVCDTRTLTNSPPELQCLDCEYRTSKRTSLLQHRRTKHPKRKTVYKCIECEFSAPKKTELQQHQRTEHPKGKAVKKSTVQKTNNTLIPFIPNADESNNEMRCENIPDEIETVPDNYDLNVDEDEVIIREVRNRLKKQELVLPTPLTQIFTGINEVDYLLKRAFSRMSLQEQLEVKRLGPHRPIDIEINQSDKKQNRFFSEKWYDKAEWLTVSETQKRFFCFYCLLFGGEVTWSKTGYNDIKHLSEKTKLHKSTSVHINNAVRFKTFGIVNIAERLITDKHSLIQRHNEVVQKHRRILSRIISAIKFCVTQELPMPDEDEDTESIFNRNVFLGLLSMVEEFDSAVYEHIHKTTVDTYTSEAVQNELIDCMYHVYKEELKKDIEKANFVSIQVEKITRVTLNPHFAIILRYMKDGVATERLLSFIEIKDRTATSLASAIKTELEPYNLRCKLIAQTYDGTVTMRGCYGGVQNCMKEFFPHALFVHSYAHSFDRILSDACSTIPALASFFGGIALFQDYFALPTRRTELLQTECNTIIPDSVENKWDTIFDAIKTVYHNQLALFSCFEKIQDEYGWSDECIRGAINFSDWLNDRKFLFFLTFFYKVLHHVEALNKAFEARVSCGDIMSAVKDFETTIIDMAEASMPDARPEDGQFKSIAKEACGIIISEIRERLEATDHLVTFSVVDPEQFRKKHKFPNDHLQVLACRYRMLVQGKLTSELKVLYNNGAFSAVKSACSLLNMLTDNELCETFSELCKLIEIVLATPFAPTGSDSPISTSEKLKKFKISDWYPDRLVIFATFMVHRDVLGKIPDFDNRVIDYFAKKEVGRERFLYVS